MEEIVFVTHNKGKIAAAERTFKNVNFKIYEHDLEEPRSDDVKFISKYNKTLAQMTDEERNNRVRYNSVSSLEEFAKWYNEEKI